MDGVKSPLQSLTVGAAGASAVATFLSAFGVAIDPALVSQGVNMTLQIFSGIMALVAIYGRLRATTRIGTDA